VSVVVPAHVHDDGIVTLRQEAAAAHAVVGPEAKL